MACHFTSSGRSHCTLLVGTDIAVTLAVDSSKVVLPDYEVDSVLSVLFVLLGDTELESKELNECDERLDDGEGDGKVCSCAIPLSEISCTSTL